MGNVTGINAALEAGSSFYYVDAETQYVALRGKDDMYFAGKTSNYILQHWIDGSIPKRVMDLVATAINNRTRERNFAQLNEQLSNGEITEQEYDKTLEEHSDEYIIQCNSKPSELDIRFATQLAPDLMGVNDTDDLAVLFSFDENEIRKYISK